MPWNKRLKPSPKAARRFATGAALAILTSGCAATTGGGNAGCGAYAEARLGRPALGTVATVPSEWAGWIADLDDRMTGTCR